MRRNPFALLLESCNSTGACRFISIPMIFCVVVLFAFVATMPQQVASNDMYLVIGQSNAAGRGELPSSLSTLPGVFVFDGDEFVPAKENVNIYSTVGKPNLIGYSLAYSFGETMTKTVKRDILLVSNARGGTKIRDWLPGEVYYEEAVKRVKDAMKVSGCSLGGVLWHQGEGDSSNGGYGSDLRTVIEGLRDEFDIDNLPFIAGELSYARGANSDFINAQLHDLDSSTLRDFAVVSADGLNAPDDTHFDAASLEELGERYAASMLKLSDNKSSSTCNGVGSSGGELVTGAFEPVSGGTYIFRSQLGLYLAADGTLENEMEVWAQSDDGSKDQLRWFIEPHPTNKFYQIKAAAGGNENMLYIKEREGVTRLEMTADRFVGANTYWEIREASGGDGYHITAIDYTDQENARMFIGPARSGAGVDPSSYSGSAETIEILTA